MAACLVLSASVCVWGDEKKADVPEPPQILMALPPAISPGETKSLTLRGLRLDQVSTVQAEGSETAVVVSILKKETSAVPDKFEAKEAGDSLVEIEYTLPVGFTADRLSFTVSNSHGMSSPFAVPVVENSALTTEVEPNDSLRKPQSISLGTTISGIISQPKDVDVFEFRGQANQRLVVEVAASQLGSLCDAHLTLFNSAGQILEIADDTANGRDPVLQLVLPRDDTYRIALLDATDRGSALNVYLLKVRVESSDVH